MDRYIWVICTIMMILMWSATSLLYKAGIRKAESHLCLKYTVSIGIVFFVIAIAYLITREEPFTIWESAARFWPMTVFGLIYPIINTVSFNGYVYNEVSVESTIEGISGGTSTILLIIAYLVLGRVKSISVLLSPVRLAGIFLILISISVLAKLRNRNMRDHTPRGSWMQRGLGTLIFPVAFSMADALETIVSGICLDTTYGYSMPEGDSIIIVGMEYAVFSVGCWIYLILKEKKPYNPFRKEYAPRLIGAITDNIGIVFYSYAMAIDAVSTDPLLAVYPVAVMLLGRLLMKEKLSTAQYLCLLGVIAGSILVAVDTIL